MTSVRTAPKWCLNSVVFADLLVLLILCCGNSVCKSLGANLDLTAAIIVAPAALSASEEKAITMLVEEVEKRTHIRWQQTTEWPASKLPVIAVSPLSMLQRLAGPYSNETNLWVSPGPEG